MKIKIKSVAIAIVTFLLFTVLPLIAPKYLPSELFVYFSMQGFDVMGLLTKIAVIGVGMTVLILLKGLVEKTSSAYLGLSAVSKIYWLFIAIFALSLGKLDNFGMLVLGGTGQEASNIIIFDLRLFVGLAALIVVLKIVHSIIEFRERKSLNKSEQPEKPLNPQVSAETNA